MLEGSNPGTGTLREKMAKKLALRNNYCTILILISIFYVRPAKAAQSV
jgi:hypothetical protein